MEQTEHMEIQESFRVFFRLFHYFRLFRNLSAILDKSDVVCGS